MQHVRNAQRGVSVFIDLNTDRFLVVGALLASVGFATAVTTWLQTI